MRVALEARAAGVDEVVRLVESACADAEGLRAAVVAAQERGKRDEMEREERGLGLRWRESAQRAPLSLPARSGEAARCLRGVPGEREEGP